MRIAIEKIWIELKNSIKEKEENCKNDIIQSEKEDIKEVVEATSFTSEDIHGGNEATGDIENSINAYCDGKENNEVTGDIENSINAYCDGIGMTENNEITGDIEISTNIETEITEIKNFINKLQSCNKEVYKSTDISSMIVETIKHISKKYVGFSRGESRKFFDKKKIVKHLLTEQEYRIPNDRHSKECRNVLFFIDTSGSVDWCFNGIRKSIEILEKQGFVCKLCGAGNGFWETDASDDPYGVRKELIRFGGELADIVRPSLDTAIRMANAAIFSVIIADFDGLSDFVKLSQKTFSSKIPYFLNIENRYTWDDPTEHDWVDPEFSYYPYERVYDVISNDDYDEDDDT